MPVRKARSVQKNLLRVLRVRIVAGGQTGADRAALDWAIARGLEHGGWCPKGRLAEDGVLDARYQLKETNSANYCERTERNVLDSEGTLIVNLGELEGGSLQTLRFAEKHQKPCLVLQLDEGVHGEEVARVLAWLRAEPIRTLNIAGPRESERPGIYQRTQEFLNRLATQLVSNPAWRESCAYF
jgi:Circularly permutated YpsA SLOG family